jgi:IclR family pca regulon transcriptional regulator
MVGCPDGHRESASVATGFNNSILRAFAILELFDEDRTEVSSATVSRELGTNAITAHRFLRTLEHVGAVTAVGRGRYRLGYRLVSLAAAAGDPHDIALRLQPTLNELARAANESAMATVFDGRSVVCIATAMSERAVAFAARVGARLEAYATANGKVWLSQLSDPALRYYLDTVPRTALSARTLVGRDALAADIATIRRRGYATNIGEREDDLTAVAVPVRSREGTMVAAMSVFGPSNRFDGAASKRAVDLSLRTAKDASMLF